MEKRFRSTALSRERWYRNLSPRFKCVWNFICDECDKAGMWEIDIDSLNFFLRDEQEFTLKDFESFMLKVNEDREENETARIEYYGKKKIWITGFTSFQYGELSSSCIPHKSIIEKLNTYGLLHRVPTKVQSTLPDRVGVTLQERKRQEKTGKEGKGKDVLENFLELELPEFLEEPPQLPPPPPAPPKSPKTPNILAETPETGSEKSWYLSNILAERDKIDDKALKMKIADYIRDKKPGFIEAYIDLWNLSSVGTGVAAIKTINDGRVRKFKTRIKEPAFDFVKILEEIKLSSHLRGDNSRGWKVTFDWILDNDSHYVKIIEGQYRNKN